MSERTALECQKDSAGAFSAFSSALFFLSRGQRSTLEVRDQEQLASIIPVAPAGNRACAAAA